MTVEVYVLCPSCSSVILSIIKSNSVCILTCYYLDEWCQILDKGSDFSFCQHLHICGTFGLLTNGKFEVMQSV
jgi:hypothetical protein